MRLFSTFFVCLLIASPAADAAAADQPIEGTKLVLTRSASGKEKLVFVSSDPAITTPAASSADDPTLTGITIDLFSNLDGASTTLTIPDAVSASPALWKETGPDYKFVHKSAPDALSGAKVLLMKDGKKLKLVAKEVPLPLSGTNGFVTIRIAMGDTRYCARFNPANVKRDYAGRFIGKKAPASNVTDCSDFGMGIIDGPILPTNAEPCPTITDGVHTFRGKSVRIRVAPDAPLQNGPLVFAWHGLGGSPNGALSLLAGNNQLQDILDMGGMVAAPDGGGPPFEFSDPIYWEVMDEVVACAMQQVGIDPFRIHSIGMSAGGLTTTILSYVRSNYLASIVAWSGGFMGTDQNPANTMPALLSHGGPSDFVFIAFEPIVEAYYAQIVSEGHFAILCRHGQGHTVPGAMGVLALDFMLDHPFGTYASPYAGGNVPASYPAYCTASE